MKYTVRIAEQTYEVEIEDIQARPVIARVDGEQFEVQPLNGIQAEVSKTQMEPNEFKIEEARKPAEGQGGKIYQLTAPLPGTIVEIFVRKGQEIETGHVVLVIEAMKMKNSIRSTRPGKIAEVLVTVGQTVAHKQPLVALE